MHKLGAHLTYFPVSKNDHGVLRARNGSADNRVAKCETSVTWKLKVTIGRKHNKKEALATRC